MKDSEMEKTYRAVLAAGMLFEWYPWTTGSWEDDKERWISQRGEEVRKEFNRIDE